MSENPWIILMTDRTRLGGAVWAVARPGPGPARARFRRTQRIGRALAFPTERKARFVANKLGERAHKILFTAVRVGPGDYQKPRTDPPRQRQTEAFPEATADG